MIQLDYQTVFPFYRCFSRKVPSCGALRTELSIRRSRACPRCGNMEFNPDNWRWSDVLNPLWWEMFWATVVTKRVIDGTTQRN